MPDFERKGVGLMRELGGGSVPHSWRALLEGGPVAGLEDGPLLERFARREGDEAAEAAFAALVARHGPMVRRVCRRLLDDPHDADDAFQATFLVLARKARAIQHPERLANWLYGTAHRASRRLRADLARRKKHEAARSSPVSEADPDRAEEAAIVLEEVASLPRECRIAVVLCDLEGLTQEEAAARLGCSDRTLRRRLTHAHDLLRARLTRRGLAPAGVAILAIGSDPLSESLSDATARLAWRFASGPGAAGVVPASASALKLAEGVLGAMTWTRWKGIAAVVGGLIALGGGIGAASGLLARPQDNPAKPKAEVRAVDGKSTAAERYRALVKRWDDALKVYQEAVSKAPTAAEQMEVSMRIMPVPKDYSPAFIALVEEFPSDPVAIDALLWVADHGLSQLYNPNDPAGKAYARALELLARDHADEPRIGTYCPSLTLSPVTIKGDFLRAIAGRSKDRVVKGRATLALADYLRMEAAMAESVQRPDLPIDFDLWFQGETSAEERRKMEADPAAFRRKVGELQAKFQPDYYKVLKQADIAALRRESEQAYGRVLAEFADVPAVIFGQATRETLADIARKHHQPRQPIPVTPASRFKPLDEAFKAALKKANDAEASAGQGMPGVKAYIAAAPKWSDFGPRMWAIAESAPRSPDGFDALLWIVRPMPFFDSYEERAATLARAVDALIADHLDSIGDHLSERKVVEAFNGWHPMPGPHADRIARALFERGKTREIRGRMGLLLARYRKAEADLIASFDARGADPDKRPEIALFAPSYLESLRNTGHRRLVEETAAAFEKLKGDYGDVPDVNGMGPTGETLATVADRELAELRTLAVGQLAPEITGKDSEGKPMALSEFRGKVVVLDFGTHEHCGGCKVVYPRQRELVEKHKARPFAILGINSGDRLETLKELAAKKEVTWRCWFDGDDILHPGPITARWNIKGYPTFLVLDHRGVIRFKDLHPFDPQFDPAIEALIKEAEAARR
jgi:RNA polymerase sigma factor (sigma-70 family)